MLGKKPWPQVEKNECLFALIYNFTELQLEQLEMSLKSYSVSLTDEYGTVS